jgi:nitrogen fixation protein FixH
MQSAAKHGAGRPPKQVTGAMVLISLVAFFGIVAGVNAVMIRFAISTFGGVETDSSYKAGLAFAKEMTAARAQDGRNWQVQATVIRLRNRQRIEVIAHDANGHPLAGIAAIVHLAHPTDRRADLRLALSEISPGRYFGIMAPAGGQWDLIVELVRGGERMFRSKHRLVITQD